MVEFNSGGNLSEQKGGKLSERYSDNHCIGRIALATMLYLQAMEKENQTAKSYHDLT